MKLLLKETMGTLLIIITLILTKNFISLAKSMKRKKDKMLLIPKNRSKISKMLKLSNNKKVVRSSNPIPKILRAKSKFLPK
jgi:hypothetical protein